MIKELVLKIEELVSFEEITDDEKDKLYIILFIFESFNLKKDSLFDLVSLLIFNKCKYKIKHNNYEEKQLEFENLISNYVLDIEEKIDELNRGINWKR